MGGLSGSLAAGAAYDSVVEYPALAVPRDWAKFPNSVPRFMRRVRGLALGGARFRTPRRPPHLARIRATSRRWPSGSEDGLATRTEDGVHFAASTDARYVTGALSSGCSMMYLVAEMRLQLLENRAPLLGNAGEDLDDLHRSGVDQDVGGVRGRGE